MALTEPAPLLDDAREAAQKLRLELQRYQRTRGPKIAWAWRCVDAVEQVRELARAIRRHARQGRVAKADLELAQLGEKLVDTVVDHALVARIYRDLGEQQRADEHALGVLRYGRSVVAIQFLQSRIQS